MAPEYCGAGIGIKEVQEGLGSLAMATALEHEDRYADGDVLPSRYRDRLHLRGVAPDVRCERDTGIGLTAAHPGHDSWTAIHERCCDTNAGLAQHSLGRCTTWQLRATKDGGHVGTTQVRKAGNALEVAITDGNDQIVAGNDPGRPCGLPTLDQLIETLLVVAHDEVGGHPLFQRRQKFRNVAELELDTHIGIYTLERCASVRKGFLEA